ncbi:MAG: SMC-Scp complex subunit ScpB [Candidatus Omnitrophota bacterium]
MEESEKNYIKGVVEALLFITDKPLVMAGIQEVLEGVDAATIKAAVEELKNDYATRHRGLSINEVAGGYQMSTSPEYAQYVKKYYKARHKEKLTGPSLETLAIVAYKQPVTRLDIESIRGVNVDGVVASLLEKGLVRIAGRKEVIGRPFVYGTTRQFLEYFGLKSLQDLPKIEEFAQIKLPSAVKVEENNEPQQLTHEG